MANLVYKRVSTAQQSTARQNLVLDEAGIEDPVVFEEQAGTSSRLHPLERPKFGKLLTYARPGDTVHISEIFRLVRGTGRILDVLHRDRLAVGGKKMCRGTMESCRASSGTLPLRRVAPSIHSSRMFR
ncbi:recombinase family protein [Streptomyces sp. APSN-46.1]|uniref:recombinase family protein n=1 Tax=Streptomyces sp. APSN-46.1 TaxID=2929049 RepID=UPI001FB2FF38|nr:recombinase family protein [Streptomyces sp. APSN-46.1]MCJ1676254.1 recombinase family protein [Streptomyces sp. APSN-46.1]